jgi:sortase A
MRQGIANRKTLRMYSRRSRPQNEASQGRYVQRVLETGFWVIAAGAFGYCSFVYASSAVHQAQREDSFNNRKAENTSAKLAVNSPATIDTNSSNQPLKDGRLLGFLDIPKIGLSSVVEEGAAPSILSRGVGHLSGTALPGERGNVGLAGHLDSYFGELSKLGIGDILTFRSMTKTYDYSIVSTHVADAAAAKVSPQSNEATLTLISYFSPTNQTKVKQLVVVARAFSDSDYSSP